MRAEDEIAVAGGEIKIGGAGEDSRVRALDAQGAGPLLAGENGRQRVFNRFARVSLNMQDGDGGAHTPHYTAYGWARVRTAGGFVVPFFGDEICTCVGRLGDQSVCQRRLL